MAGEKISGRGREGRNCAFFYGFVRRILAVCYGAQYALCMFPGFIDGDDAVAAQCQISL